MQEKGKEIVFVYFMSTVVFKKKSTENSKTKIVKQRVKRVKQKELKELKNVLLTTCMSV